MRHVARFVFLLTLFVALSIFQVDANILGRVSSTPSSNKVSSQSNTHQYEFKSCMFLEVIIGKMAMACCCNSDSLQIETIGECEEMNLSNCDSSLSEETIVESQALELNGETGMGTGGGDDENNNHNNDNQENLQLVKASPTDVMLSQSPSLKDIKYSGDTSSHISRMKSSWNNFIFRSPSAYAIKRILNGTAYNDSTDESIANESKLGKGDAPLQSLLFPSSSLRANGTDKQSLYRQVGVVQERNLQHANTNHSLKLHCRHCFIDLTLCHSTIMSDIVSIPRPACQRSESGFVA